MTNYELTEYDTIDDLKTAVEAIDNTINIRPINVISFNERKFALIKGGVVGFDGGAL